MANIDGSAPGTPAATSPYHQRQLFALISTLVSPRAHLASDPLCQVIIDGSLPWVSMPLAEGGSVLYLARPALVQQFADCLLVRRQP